MTNQLSLKTEFVYLVYAPELVHWSAGIKVLHKLHEGINAAGFESHLISHGTTTFKKRMQTCKLIKSLNRRSNTIFTAIYPEPIPGNPLGVQKQIRWILNTPGLLGGVNKFTDATIWSYSQKLADQYQNLANEKTEVLFIPGLDLKEFDEVNSTNTDENDHEYKLVYAQKFRALGGQPDINGGEVKEITRFNANSSNREETLSLIKNAKEIHAFENTTVITEAQLLGKPVYCHRNFGFEFLIAEIELGSEGVSWNVDSTPTPNPRLVRERIQFHEGNFKFVIRDLLTKYEAQNDFQGLVKISYNPFTASFKHKLSRLVVLLQTKGPRTSLRFIKLYLLRIFHRN